MLCFLCVVAHASVVHAYETIYTVSSLTDRPAHVVTYIQEEWNGVPNTNYFWMNVAVSAPASTLAPELYYLDPGTNFITPNKPWYEGVGAARSQVGACDSNECDVDNYTYWQEQGAAADLIKGYTCTSTGCTYNYSFKMEPAPTETAQWYAYVRNGSAASLISHAVRFYNPHSATAIETDVFCAPVAETLSEDAQILHSVVPGATVRWQVFAYQCAPDLSFENGSKCAYTFPVFGTGTASGESDAHRFFYRWGGDLSSRAMADQQTAGIPATNSRAWGKSLRDSYAAGTSPKVYFEYFDTTNAASDAWQDQNNWTRIQCMPVTVGSDLCKNIEGVQVIPPAGFDYSPQADTCFPTTLALKGGVLNVTAQPSTARRGQSVEWAFSISDSFFQGVFDGVLYTIPRVATITWSGDIASETSTETMTIGLPGVDTNRVRTYSRTGAAGVTVTIQDPYVTLTDTAYVDITE